MNIYSAGRYMAIVLVVLSFIACSGSGVDDMFADGGIGGTGVISTGEVTAIGSVWVNGLEFDTQSSEVYVNDVYLGSGDQAISNNLDPGRIVRVSGRLSEDGFGQADQVFYASTLSGPIDTVDVIDDYNTILIVLDQTVIIDDRTQMSGVVGDTPAVGNLVEVSGFFDDADRIQATFLIKTADVVPADARFRISGPVSNLDKDERSFFIGTLAIDYETADVSGADPEGLVNSGFVSVVGQLDGPGFRADTVRSAGRLGPDAGDGEKVEIEGIIGADFTRDRFVIEGYLIETGLNTAFIGGTQEDILPGSRIEVEGIFTDGGLAAEKIKFSQDFRAESDLVDLVELSDSTLTLMGLEDLAITVNDLTRVAGLADSLEDLNAGDHLKVRGWIVEGQAVVAGQIIALPSVQDKINLRGTVSAVSELILSINGVAIDTDMIPPMVFYTDEDVPISSATFFSRVWNGTWVEVKGNLLPDGSAAWQSITLVQVF